MKGEPKEAIVDTAEIRDVGFALSRSDAIERDYFIHTQSRESTTAIGSAPLGGCPCMLVIADGSLPSVDKTLSRRSGKRFLPAYAYTIAGDGRITRCASRVAAA